MQRRAEREWEKRKAIKISYPNADFLGLGFLSCTKQILEHTFIRFSKPYGSAEVHFAWLEMDTILNSTVVCWTYHPLIPGGFWSCVSWWPHRNQRQGNLLRMRQLPHPGRTTQSTHAAQGYVYRVHIWEGGCSLNVEIYNIRDKMKYLACWGCGLWVYHSLS